MGENDVEVIDLLSSTPWAKRKKKVLVAGESDCDSEIKHVVCLKNANDLERYEKTEDCFIIDFAPVDLSKLFDADDENAPEISVVYEKGQVACRDYPHSRHLCLKFPFATTTHKSHCNMCYCYVCDTPAPCSSWGGPALAHCDAWCGDDWEALRLATRKLG